MIVRNPAWIAVAAVLIIHATGGLTIAADALEGIDKALTAVIHIPKLIPQLKDTFHATKADPASGAVLRAPQPANKRSANGQQ